MSYGDLSNAKLMEKYHNYNEISNRQDVGSHIAKLFTRESTQIYCEIEYRKLQGLWNIEEEKEMSYGWEKGTEIKFKHPGKGLRTAWENSKKHLVDGNVYTVDYMETYRGVLHVFLVECPKVRFTASQFEEIPSNGEKHIAVDFERIKAQEEFVPSTIEEPVNKVRMRKHIDSITALDDTYSVGSFISIKVDGEIKRVTITKIRTKLYEVDSYELIGEIDGTEFILFSIKNIPVILKYGYTTK